MSKYQQRSAGTREFVIFAVIVLGGACAWQWYTRKPPIIQRVVVHDLPAPPPVQEVAPAPVVVVPAPKPQPAPVAAPAPQIVAIPAPPPTPESQILEGELTDAQAAAKQAKADLDATTATAVQQLHGSPDYIAAKSDVEAKKVAKDAAVEQLQKVTRDGDDIDTATANLRTAESDWLTATQKLNDLQNQNVAADPAVAQKQQALQIAMASVADLQKRLSTCIQNDMSAVAKDDQCPIKSFTYDPASASILAVLSPSRALTVGEAADRALIEIGHMLEKVLHNAPFTWDSAVFRVEEEYNGQRAAAFQVTYTRDGVDTANFATIDRGASLNDQGLINLAADFWLSPLINMMQDPRTISAAGAAVPFGEQAAAYSPGVFNNGYSDDILVIGGYTRLDGTYCQPIYIHKKHGDKNRANPPSAPTRTAGTGSINAQTSSQSSAVAGTSQQRTQSQSNQTKSTQQQEQKPAPAAPPPKQQQSGETPG
jgi:hypothetical protein